MRAVSIVLAAALLPTAAFAHAGHGEAAGFLHGFAHPLGGLDHVLAMLGVGLLAFVVGGRALWAVPAAFVGMMVLGFVLGTAGLGLPFVETGIALSVVAIGAAVAFGTGLPLAAAAGLVGAFALFHGHAHGAEMPAGAASGLYALGFAGATALLHGSGIAAAAAAARLLGRHGRLVARLGGGAFALLGLGLLGGVL